MSIPILPTDAPGSYLKLESKRQARVSTSSGGWYARNLVDSGQSMRYEAMVLSVSISPTGPILFILTGSNFPDLPLWTLKSQR